MEFLSNPLGRSLSLLYYFEKSVLLLLYWIMVYVLPVEQAGFYISHSGIIRNYLMPDVP